MTCISIDAPLPLFELAQDTMRRRLLGSPLGGLLPGEKVADLFCGAGGWGEGAREIGIHVDFAVNHWGVAIDTHRTNNPGCLHRQGDAWRMKPRDVVGGATLGLLLASAACTTHSRARGSAPISKRVHMLGWCIARWMESVAPRIVLIENVPEWRDWGPTVLRHDGVKVQDPARKGQHFRRWWRYCERLGYAMEMRVLDAPDYGEASRRRRLFIIARRDGQPIVWPEKTHGRPVAREGRSSDQGVGSDAAVQFPDVRILGRNLGTPQSPVRGPRTQPIPGSRAPRSGNGSLAPYRTAAECIDWSDLGTSIFARKRPLRPKTLARIAEGIRRFVLNDPSPFVIRVTHTGGESNGWKVWPVDQPMPTQTTRQDIAVATPILATTGYGERDGQASRVHRVTELLGTCVDGVKQGLVTLILAGAGGSGYAGKPCPVDRPFNTVKCDGRQSLVAPVLAHFRHGGGQNSRADAPLPAVVAEEGGHEHRVIAPGAYYGNADHAKRPDKPLGTVTTVDRHVEFVIVDILFRMLRPAELAKAMGFRESYVWPRTQRDTVRLIGNAVSVKTARALVGSVLPLGRAPETGEAVCA